LDKYSILQVCFEMLGLINSMKIIVLIEAYMYLEQIIGSNLKAIELNRINCVRRVSLVTNINRILELQFLIVHITGTIKSFNLSNCLNTINFLINFAMSYIMISFHVFSFHYIIISAERINVLCGNKMFLSHHIIIIQKVFSCKI
jgi:hypothetical protein